MGLRAIHRRFYIPLLCGSIWLFAMLAQNGAISCVTSRAFAFHLLVPREVVGLQFSRRSQECMTKFYGNFLVAQRSLRCFYLLNFILIPSLMGCMTRQGWTFKDRSWDADFVIFITASDWCAHPPNSSPVIILLSFKGFFWTSVFPHPLEISMRSEIALVDMSCGFFPQPPPTQAPVLLVLSAVFDSCLLPLVT